VDGLEQVWTFVRNVAEEAPAAYATGVWILVTVFLWSGLAKLRRPATAATALSDFGVTRTPSAPLGTALGAVEAVLAVSLAATSAHADVRALVPALAACVLLWSFTFLIMRSLHRGDDFACHCFGESEDRLSRWTAVRTAGLAVLATGAVGVNVTAEHSAGTEAVALSAVAGLAVVGGTALASHIRDLLRWNRRFWETETA
jgi:hypothetical protein